MFCGFRLFARSSGVTSSLDSCLNQSPLKLGQFAAKHVQDLYLCVCFSIELPDYFSVYLFKTTGYFIPLSRLKRLLSFLS